MSALPKRGEIRLRGDEYRAVVRQCYERDHWQCVRCQTRAHLTPHHLVARSDLRKDTLDNLVTLCVDCHTDVERSIILIIGLDANALLKFRRAT